VYFWGLMLTLSAYTNPQKFERAKPVKLLMIYVYRRWRRL